MNIKSVSEVNAYIKKLLARAVPLQGILIQGEISNFKLYPSGHAYFTLKDGRSAIKCVMFRSYASRLRFRPENGMKVIAGGRIDVFERDGVYQLYVESLTPDGVGELALAFEKLKEKLYKEGLFDETHKKPLPRFPKKIGVVTSLAGAVLRDVYHVSSRRWPMVSLVLYPVQVQGEGSAGEIAAGIDFFNRVYPVDTLIVGRGGGSMEDLWSFNEEIVVRAIYASKIPVISAVGHETDFTLADFVSDMRAATPSQAAELAVPDRVELLRYVRGLDQRLARATEGKIDYLRERLLGLLKRPSLSRPEELLSERRQRLDMTIRRLQELSAANVKEKRHALTVSMEKLSVLSPLNVLKRGYGMVEKDGVPIASTSAVSIGDKLKLTMRDGALMVVAEERMS